LWGHAVRAKYVTPDMVMDWIKSPIKQQNNASIIWKAIIYYFHLVGDWMIWQIGKGDKMQIGLNPWVERKGQHTLLVYDWGIKE